ncbi:hypothetical protein NHX12_010225 [Muraenolepis orangiensis]|uniref:Sex-determining region Y protein n=1 Tax=Muraenolepis orangiensis TaxID=630683 RepID=A0A9Q0DE48_9TELE|nr:hypothetical protein NHX12_013297 [Muraenolepis orangiensis]KAJ3589380.1 hypothetical protein NHX12_010225 [Muraenolepis orangiensis]
MNAFMVWARARRPVLSRDHPRVASADISVRLGTEWTALTEDEKAPYYQESWRLKVIHQQQFPGWTYKPPRRRKKECAESERPSTRDSVQAQEEEPWSYDASIPHQVRPLETDSGRLPPASTHSLTPATTSVPASPPLAGVWPSDVADPRTSYPGPSPSSRPSPSQAFTSCPQGLIQGQLLPEPSPSSVVCSSIPEVPAPLGFYPNPHFGPYCPSGFFSGLQYDPQSYPNSGSAAANVLSYYESPPQWSELAALNLEYLQCTQQQAGADASRPGPQGAPCSYAAQTSGQYLPMLTGMLDIQLNPSHQVPSQQPQQEAVGEFTDDAIYLYAL